MTCGVGDFLFERFAVISSDMHRSTTGHVFVFFFKKAGVSHTRYVRDLRTDLHSHLSQCRG